MKLPIAILLSFLAGATTTFLLIEHDITNKGYRMCFEHVEVVKNTQPVYPMIGIENGK